MVSVYASCKSYADHGKARTTFYEGSVPRTIDKPFSTAFERPSRFRFEFTEQGADWRTRRFIVWRDESNVKSWWTIQPETRTHENLSQALGAAHGVSGGSALNVPSMLTGDLMDSGRIQTITELVLKGEEKVGGKKAYRIEGRDWQHRLLTIWIDKESFLLLKIHEQMKLKGVESETTITYQPRINVNIKPDELAFNN
jgi:hypothetical protein